MTAPLPKINTVLVLSENGSRLSLPPTARAPFTVTGTSRATGCGRAAVSSPRPFAGNVTGAAAPDAAVITSFSLVIGAIRMLTCYSKNLFSSPMSEAVPEHLHGLLPPCLPAIVRAYQEGNTCPEGQPC